MEEQKKCTDEKLLKLIYQHLEVPSQFCQVHGLSVVSFMIDKEGNVANIQIVKSLHPEVDKAILKSMEKVKTLKWKPGYSNYFREKMDVKYAVPIRIKRYTDQ
jgi:TonB family protein